MTEELQDPFTAEELSALLWAVRHISHEALVAGPHATSVGAGHGALSSATNKVERRLGMMLGSWPAGGDRARTEVDATIVVDHLHGVDDDALHELIEHGLRGRVLLAGERDELGEPATIARVDDVIELWVKGEALPR